MASNSLITQEQLQSDFEDFYSQKIYPFLNGATHAGFTPVGSVIAIMGNEAPNHYLACDGTLYTIADYPQLTAYFEDQFGSVNFFGGDGTTTFAVPDLRGEFLRGTGTNSHTDQGNGANVGTHQDGTKIPYFQLENYTTPKMSFLALDSNHQTSYISNSDKNLKGDTTRIDITGSSGTTPDPYNIQSYTSRPTNTSVLWCIAYENTYIDGSGESSGGGHKIQNEDDLEPLTQRKTMLLNEPLVASDDAEGGNTVVDVDTDVDLSVIHAPGTAGNVDGHIYSTDETVVGKWIDGKPLYEKTITATYNTGVADQVMNSTLISYSSLGLFNIDKVVSFDGTRANSALLNQAWITSNVMYFSYVAFDTPNSNVILGTNRGTLGGVSNTITVRYTKTTDTV